MYAVLIMTERKDECEGKANRNKQIKRHFKNVYIRRESKESKKNYKE